MRGQGVFYRLWVKPGILGVGFLFSAHVLNLPNLITLIRIAAIPLFLILLTAERYGGALLLFGLSALTDSLDGAIARLTHSRTVFGAYIDPLADKLLLASSLIFLSFLGLIPLWLTIVVVSRDIVILLGFVVLFLASGRAIEVEPSFLGKGSTFLQLLTVTLTLLFLYRPEWHWPWVWQGVLFLAGGATILSGIQYFYRGLLWLGEQEESQTDSREEEPKERGFSSKAG